MAKKKTKSIRDYTALGSISAELILKNLMFFFFLAFLAMIYIANAHYSEKKVTEIQKMQKELKQMRWHYISMQSKNMTNSRRSEVVKQVKDIGLKTNVKKPNKIIVPRGQQ